MVEWIRKSIGELFSISGGRSASRAQLSDNGYFYLHYGDIHGSSKTYIDTDEDKAVIPRLNVPLNKVSAGSLLQDGDVVFVDASEDDIGASRHIVVRNTGEVPFIAGLHTIVAKPLTDETIREYREYCFQTADVISQFKHYAVGTKVTGISKTTIKKICILFPKSLSEQRAIASALSDADGYIAALERFIEKKRDIKQGAMQELFKPKDGWIQKKVGDLADIFSGGTPRTGVSEYWNGNIVWVTPSDITGQREKYLTHSEHNITQQGLNNSAATLLPTGTILLCTRATIGELAIAAQPTATNQGLKNLVCHGDTINEFLYYALQPLKPKILEKAFGSTFLEISKNALASIDIWVPLFAEQTRIAEILSDMDVEIGALTAKLNKAKLIKKGMMEQLLTGKIRLAETETKVDKAEETNKQGYNEGFRDAVILVALVKKFGTEEHPFTSFDCQKFPYLFHRHVEGNAKGYKKMPGGPI